MIKLILMPLMMIAGCGAVERAETDAQTAETLEAAAPTPTPTATPASVSSATGIEVNVTVNENVLQESEQNFEGQNACGGPIQSYLVLDRETDNWPWRVVSQSQYKEDADTIANGLLEQGYFPSNVSVVEQYDGGCIPGSPTISGY